ncbi:MAG: translation initiation factor [[Clostridium] fimetarium]|nr:translation initiation factor [Alistipes timonensis]MCM1405326.1 translation initiation factor [[Clostridium] fimetarium]
MDWKDSLASLMAELPEEPAAEPAEGEQKDAGAPAETARLDILLDKKGRKGKAATIVCGFTVDDNAVDAIAAELKKKLGTGGSSRGGEILIQGDKRAQVESALKAMGLKCRVI